MKREFAPDRLSIVEFAESSEYCNKPLYPRQRVLLKLIFLEEMEGWEEDILSDWIRGGYSGEITISPMIRERRDWLRENGYPHFRQYQLVGGRSSSKGYLTGIVAAKKVYDARQLLDPGRYYGIDPDKEIYFSCVAASLDQAKKYLFADMVSTLTRCQPLDPHLSKVMEEGIYIHTPADKKYEEKLKSQGVPVARNWAKLRAAPQAANADTIRGQRALFLAFDEMAWMLPGESRSSAEECYAAAVPAMLPFGRDALIALQSSPYTRLGRFYEEFEKAMAISETTGQPEVPYMFALQFPSWALFQDRQEGMRYDQARIAVSPDWPDEWMNDEEKARANQEKIEEEANPEEYRVERRGQWAEAVDAYLNPIAVERAFLPMFINEEYGIKRPITQNLSGTYNFQYAIHCDPSSTTAGFGLAVGHSEIMPHPHFPQGVKHVIFDLVKRWNPADFPEHTIQYPTVQREIIDLITWFFPFEVTFDQYNSTQLIQGLRIDLMGKRGFDNTRIHEINNTNADLWEKWEATKTAINLGLVHIPPDCDDSWYAEQELKLLKKEDAGRIPRVEKQDIGPIQTKDIADCVREIVWKFIGQQMREFTNKAFEQPLQTGAQGGYRIGGGSQESNRPYTFDDFYGGRANPTHGSEPSRGFDPRFRTRRPGRGY